MKKRFIEQKEKEYKLVRKNGYINIAILLIVLLIMKKIIINLLRNFIYIEVFFLRMFILNWKVNILI